MKKFITRNPEFIITALIALLICFLCKTGKAQYRQYQPKETTPNGIILTGAGGITNKYFAADLQAGYRIGNYTLSLAYLALPHNTQPVIFQLRAGINILNHWHVYAAPAKVMFSGDDKTRNYYSYAIGLQYHTKPWDRGSFWIGTQYTPAYTSILIGMSYNLMHKAENQ